MNISLPKKRRQELQGLGMPPQTYSSFADMAAQIGNARVLAGIHTRHACTQGRLQGKKIAQNILKKLEFLK